MKNPKTETQLLYHQEILERKRLSSKRAAKVLKRLKRQAAKAARQTGRRAALDSL